MLLGEDLNIYLLYEEKNCKITGPYNNGQFITDNILCVINFGIVDIYQIDSRESKDEKLGEMG